MPDKTTEFRTRAAEARAKAAVTSDPEIRAALLEIAATWELLMNDREDALLADWQGGPAVPPLR